MYFNTSNQAPVELDRTLLFDGRYVAYVRVLFHDLNSNLNKDPPVDDILRSACFRAVS